MLNHRSASTAIQTVVGEPSHCEKSSRNHQVELPGFNMYSLVLSIGFKLFFLQLTNKESQKEPAEKLHKTALQKGSRATWPSLNVGPIFRGFGASCLLRKHHLERMDADLGCGRINS